MDCEYATRDDVIVEYVEGSLGDDAREAFEAHYFGCDRCFAQLQMTEKLIGSMQKYGDEVFARFRDPAGSMSVQAQRLPTYNPETINWMGRLPVVWHQRFRIAARFAVAALLILTVGSWFLKYFVFPIDYKQLTAVQPIPWPAVTPLGSEADTLLAQARQQYLEMEYQGASNTLAEAIGLYPPIATLKYIHGVSSYFANDTDEAIAQLEAALRLDPALDDARWYLAHAYLKKRDRENAIKQLAELVETKSAYESRSREILKAIDPFYFLGRGF
jgi:tetratricopeptide (TPR) repeat protein